MMTFGTDYTYSTIDSTTGGITQTYAYYYSTYYQTTDYPTGGGGIQLPELPLLPAPGSLGGGSGEIQFVLPDFSPCPQVTHNHMNTQVLRKTSIVRLMGLTGSGWWSSFLVRMEITPQFVCHRTAL